MNASCEHPFAAYVRVLGRGRRGARSLHRDEARAAMAMLLRGDATPEQIGAFLMLLRVREETPDELAGMVAAARDSLRAPLRGIVELDWPSYAGKRRHLPWYLLAALLLARQGIRILMHGAGGNAPGRLYAAAVLQRLGIAAAPSWAAAEADLRARAFAYLPLEVVSPPLQRLIDLKAVLGLRSPVHSLVRMLNPAAAPHSLQGIFHPGYDAVHQQTAALLGDTRVAVFKGEGGEAERNPDAPAAVLAWTPAGGCRSIDWRASFARRHRRPARLEVDALLAVWHGERSDEYGETALVGTAAIALHLLGHAASPAEAQRLALALWREHLGARRRAAG